MPAVCAVPTCKSGSRCMRTKYSMFNVPQDRNLRKKWENAIPGITSLRDKQVVCAKHFTEDCIRNKFVRKDVSGNIIIEILQSSLEWLDAWERLVKENKLSKDEFLTDVTAQNLRLSLHSTLDLCNYMINNYGFQYLLTGKVNQHNLEKFFGTIRQAAGCNDHPTSATFLSLYKILSTYSVLKPPRAGNCTVNKKENLKTLITMEDLKDLRNSKTSTYSDSLKSLKEKLDKVIDQDDWEVDDVLFDEHDYFRAEVLECIIYYTTGYLCKQLLKKYKNCLKCSAALKCDRSTTNPVAELVNLKSEGRLIYSNINFFRLIRFVECCFDKHASSVDVFEHTLEEVYSTYKFTFPCLSHASDILAYALHYYIRMRMRQYSYQENKKLKKKFVPQKKMAKLNSQ